MRTKIALVSGAMVLLLVVLMAQPVPVIRRLRDLQDVKPKVPPASGDGLIYNSSLALWTNGPVGATGDVTNTYNTVITTNLTVLNSLYASNFFVTNVTVQNNLTVSNLYTVNGNHNTLIVTNTLTPTQVGNSKLVATASNGALTNADGVFATRGSILYKAAGGWTQLVPNTSGYVLTDGGVGADPTWAAAAGGGGGGSIYVNGTSVTNVNIKNGAWDVYDTANTTNITARQLASVTALTWSTTNLLGADLAASKVFTILMTNNAFLGTSSFSNLPTKTQYGEWVFLIQQDSTGGYFLNITNSIAAWAEGVAAVIQTNANAINYLYAHTDLTTNSTLVFNANLNCHR